MCSRWNAGRQAGDTAVVTFNSNIHTLSSHVSACLLFTPVPYVTPGIEYIKSPVLLFHGEQDTIVPPSTALKLVQK